MMDAGGRLAEIFPGGSRMATPFVSRRLGMLVTLGAIALVSMSAATPATHKTSAAAPPAANDSKPWTGDFDGMLQRRHIRVLVPYSKTLYYVEKGEERGLTAELARDFGKYLNQKHAKELGGRPITITLIPTTRDKLLSDLDAGKGDISGGNLTETPSRLKLADFVAPTERDPAHEVLVSGPGAPAVLTLDDLSDKKVSVRKSSSYYESLAGLSSKLSAAGKPAVQIVPLPDALEDEDVLELLNAGLFPLTVVDSWKAKLWGEMLPHIQVHDGIVLRSGGTIGWAIRKNSPGIKAELEGFYKTASQQGLIDSRLTLYQARIKELSNNTTAPALKHFDDTMKLFRSYGKKYEFDPLMLAAEGFQESQLNSTAGHTTAVVASQSAVPTGADLEKNIQAGQKYEEQLKTKYFADAKFSEIDRPLFAFASYQAGPDKIAQMRSEAAKRGLDPNQWFNNVELVTAEKLGMETTNYVRGIYKYYVAYKLTTGTS